MASTEALEDTWILEVEGARKAYGGSLALRGATLSFREGEYFCLLGPSGCGKTTLLRLIAGLEQPDDGDLRLAGRSLVGVPPERRDVNTVFQSYALFPHMTLRENVAFGPRMKGWPEPEVQERSLEFLELVQLADAADRYPDQLSGGQRQRVALARALVNRPRVLLLDEPLAALDRNLRMAMQRELRRIQRATATTFIHVTHDQEEALALSDRLALMSRGRLVQVGTPEEVYARPRCPFAATFLGSANLLEGELSGEALVVGGFLSLPRPAEAEGTGAVRVMVRPENLRIQPAAAAPEGTFRATVQEVRRLGSDLEIDLRVGEQDLVTRTTRVRELPELGPGAEVAVAVAPEDVVLLGEDLS